jgi:hypothetical protein
MSEFNVRQAAVQVQKAAFNSQMQKMFSLRDIYDGTRCWLAL